MVLRIIYYANIYCTAKVGFKVLKIIGKLRKNWNGVQII